MIVSDQGSDDHLFAVVVIVMMESVLYIYFVGKDPE